MHRKGARPVRAGGRRKRTRTAGTSPYGLPVSRLLVDGRFFAHENARACQDLLRRAIARRSRSWQARAFLVREGKNRSRPAAGIGRPHRRGPRAGPFPAAPSDRTSCVHPALR